MKLAMLWCACLVALTMVAEAGEVYRWFDENGSVHYGDAPPAAAVNVERMEIPDTAEPDEALPFETRRAQQNFPVILYVGADCGSPCHQARDLLNKRGIPYTENFLKFNSALEAFKTSSGAKGFPVLQVGKSYLEGFLTGQWHSELDIAGYPRTAPYRQRLTAPKPAEPEKEQAAPDESPAQ